MEKVIAEGEATELQSRGLRQFSILRRERQGVADGMRQRKRADEVRDTSSALGGGDFDWVGLSQRSPGPCGTDLASARGAGRPSVRNSLLPTAGKAKVVPKGPPARA